jgi:transcriptional regulator
VSHLPIVPAPARDDVAILGHLARADATKHELGQHDTVLIVQGPHGYVSPTWYVALTTKNPTLAAAMRRTTP